MTWILVTGLAGQQAAMVSYIKGKSEYTLGTTSAFIGWLGSEQGRRTKEAIAPAVLPGRL